MITDIRTLQTARTAKRSKLTGESNTTILAQGHELSCNTRETQLNNNMLVLGPTGAGKTRYVLKPNLLQKNASYVVIDTKGTLAKEVGPALEKDGYKVWEIDFAHGMQGNIGYDPFNALDYTANPLPGYRYDETALMALAEVLCQSQSERDAYWDNAARRVIVALMACEIEMAADGCACFGNVVDLYKGLYRMVEEEVPRRDGRRGTEVASVDETTRHIMDYWNRCRDDSAHAPELFKRALSIRTANNTWSCIESFLDNSLRGVLTPQACAMYECPEQIDFTRLGKEHIALFVTVSDVNPAMRPLVDLFLSQAFEVLEYYADTQCENHRLPVPVRFFLDDFSNLSIPNIVDAIAVVRSREIWITMLCQSVAQISHKYHEAAESLIANCSSQLILGFADQATAEFYAPRAERRVSTLLNAPLGNAWLFVSGQQPVEVKRYELTEHPCYQDLPEAQELGEELQESLGLSSKKQETLNPSLKAQNCSKAA